MEAESTAKPQVNEPTLPAEVTKLHRGVRGALLQQYKRLFG